MAGGEMTVAIDVTDATFETEVLERSTQATVVVDLWAAWCGPCRIIGPILERVVAERPGDVVLTKIDVDSNPRSAATFQVQSIPAVYALRDRKVVSGFVGAIPEPEVRKWLDQVAPAPTEVDELIASGDEASLRRALEMEPANTKAIVALATLLVAERSPERAQEAIAVLARIPETPEVRHLLAQARVGGEADKGDAGVTSKLDALLDSVKADPAARREYLDLLELMGDDPRVPEYRKALTSRLF
jgi:putative thioredoxin